MIQENASNEDRMQQLTREISQLINDKLLVEVGSPEDDLLASGVLDSLTLVQLLFDLEQPLRRNDSLGGTGDRRFSLGQFDHPFGASAHRVEGIEEEDSYRFR